MDDFRDVSEFLRQFWFALEFRQLKWHDHPRRDVELEVLGVTRSQVVKHLAKLKPAHFHRGPEPDDMEPEYGTIYVFRYPMDPEAETDVYVKLSLIQHRTKKREFIAKIWSFKPWGQTDQENPI